MTWYLAGAVLFCAGVTMWAQAVDEEMHSALWALLTLVNTLAYKMNMRGTE